MQDLVVVAGEIVSAVSSGAPNYRVETVTDAHISLTGDSHVRLRGVYNPLRTWEERQKWESGNSRVRHLPNDNINAGILNTPKALETGSSAFLRM